MPISFYRSFLACIGVCFLVHPLSGQGSDLLLNHDLYHIIDRLDISGSTDSIVHTEVKPYSRDFVDRIFQRMQSRSEQAENASTEGWYDLMHSIGSEKPISKFDNKKKRDFMGSIYQNGRDLFEVTTPNLHLVINPVAHFARGPGSK